jgi:hypothetical protein
MQACTRNLSADVHLCLLFVRKWLLADDLFSDFHPFYPFATGVTDRQSTRDARRSSEVGLEPLSIIKNKR